MKKVLPAVLSMFCMKNLHLSPSVALCFRFHCKQFFFWYVHTWLEPVDAVQYTAAYSPAALTEQRHSVFPGLAGVPYQEATIFILGNNTSLRLKIKRSYVLLICRFTNLSKLSAASLRMSMGVPQSSTGALPGYGSCSWNTSCEKWKWIKLFLKSFSSTFIASAIKHTSMCRQREASIGWVNTNEYEWRIMWGTRTERQHYSDHTHSNFSSPFVASTT